MNPIPVSNFKNPNYFNKVIAYKYRSDIETKSPAPKF